MGRYRTVRSAERIGGSPAPRARTSARSPLSPNPVRAVSDPDRAEAPLGRQRPLPGWTRTTPRLAPPDWPATDSARCTAEPPEGVRPPGSERIESPLPDVAGGVIMPLVAADVGREQPVHPAAQVSIPQGPESQMKNGSATRNIPESAWESAASLRPGGRQTRRNHRLCEKPWPGYCPGSARESIDWRLRHGQYAASRSVLERASTKISPFPILPKT